MKKAIFLSIIAIFFSCFSVQAQKDEGNPKSKKAKQAEITFEKLEHNYGNIYQGDNGECEFVFKNTGKAPLTIQNCRASCGCTVPSWPKEPIPPGKKSVIKVKYDTNRIGTISKTITVTSDAINNSVQLKITGHISTKPVESVPEQEAPMMRAQ